MTLLCTSSYTCGRRLSFPHKTDQLHRANVGRSRKQRVGRPPPQRPTVATAARATSTPPGTGRPQPPTANYPPPHECGPPPPPSTMDRYRSEVTMAAQDDEPSTIPRRLRSSSTASAARCLLLFPFLPLPFPPLPPALLLWVDPALTCPTAPRGTIGAPVPYAKVGLSPPFSASSIDPSTC